MSLSWRRSSSSRTIAASVKISRTRLMPPPHVTRSGRKHVSPSSHPAHAQDARYVPRQMRYSWCFLFRPPLCVSCSMACGDNKCRIRDDTQVRTWSSQATMATWVHATHGFSSLPKPGQSGATALNRSDSSACSGPSPRAARLRAAPAGEACAAPFPRILRRR